jgi:cytidyltransferase-like protein
MDTVVIYPGRFHPFHKGHKSVYDALVKRFGKNRVYIATSNKVDPPKSPFTFDEKRAMMALTGVDPSRVVQVKNPYQATEITDNYDPQNTIALFAVSDKDMAEDPRFSFKPRKDGQPSYYQPASKDMQGFDKHGYIVTVPTLQFNVLGKPMRSASEFRANFARADSETQRAMITDLFGQYDPKTHNTMAQKIVEQLIRADEILDKLIEMGADDCYILEACIRVESLVESINMKQRKQTLYQAIMEGGHSLPVTEAELACPVAAGDLAVNTENRDRTIKQFNYGPLNVDIPGDYWEKIADYWDTTEQAAKASNCGNCVAFDISERMKDCLPGDTFDDDGELGYCWMHHFKCHSARSCHTWAKGGPIKTEKESAEWQGKAFGVKEEITDFNTEDPMNSVIAIRGIGTMSISSALEKVSEMAMDIAKLGAMKDAKNVQDNLPRYMDLLATYNESIQEAYRELAQQRKRGGTASRGIDKDISEAKSDNLSTDNVDPRFKNLIKTAIIKYPFAKDAMDAVLHMMSDKLKTDAAQSADIKRLDKENDAQDTEIDDLEKQIAKEHCGDPMAHEHAPGRTLLMKLYKKEMECKPGSPEHFEVMKMIDGCRKNIGLEEGMWDTVTKTVGGAAKAVGKTVQGAVDQRTATLTGGKKKSVSSFRPS